jgi:hypothetical protein
MGCLVNVWRGRSQRDFRALAGGVKTLQVKTDAAWEEEVEESQSRPGTGKVRHKTLS